MAVAVGGKIAAHGCTGYDSGLSRSRMNARAAPNAATVMVPIAVAPAVAAAPCPKTYTATVAGIPVTATAILQPANRRRARPAASTAADGGSGGRDTPASAVTTAPAEQLPGVAPRVAPRPGPATAPRASAAPTTTPWPQRVHTTPTRTRRRTATASRAARPALRHGQAQEADAKDAAGQLGHDDEAITKKHYIVKPALAPDSSHILEKLGPGQPPSDPGQPQTA